jgi:transposase
VNDCPSDFDQFAPGKRLTVIAAHYGVGVRTVRHWRKERGIEPLIPQQYAGRLRRPVPASFDKIAPTQPIKNLAKYYGTGRETVRRWLDETGIEAGKRVYSHRAPKRYKPMHNFGTSPVRIKHGEDSLAARAADECLRRYAPTFRCDEAGNQQSNGHYWLHGRVVLSDDELIARAERKGWNPDAWKVIAA